MHARKGFTLIETIIALGILTAALAGAMTLIVQATNLSLNSRNATAGNSLMQKKLSDTIAVICTGCTPSVSPTALSAALGPSTVTSSVCIDDDGVESASAPPCGSGSHETRKFYTTGLIDNVNYYSSIYVDENFTDISPTHTGAGSSGVALNSTDYIKIISEVKWNFKGINYSNRIVQYIRKTL